MKNEFNLTCPKNVILFKFIRFVLVLISGCILLLYFIHASKNYLYFLLPLGFLCLIPLILLKGYKIAGQIKFDVNNIRIATDNKTIDIPIHSIVRIDYYLKALHRSSYIPTLLIPFGVYLLNNSGNILEMITESNRYKLSVHLSSNLEKNAMISHLNKLADSGVLIREMKLAQILRNHL